MKSCIIALNALLSFPSYDMYSFRCLFCSCNFLKVILFNCIAHHFSASYFCLISARARSELGRFSMKTELFVEINCRFLQNEPSDPLSYSIYLKKIRLCGIYPNLKNFSSFNFQIFRLIHHYNVI